jgi:hypothetical protein
MNDSTNTTTFRDGTYEEKKSQGVPDYLWMGVNTGNTTPSNVVGAGMYTEALNESQTAWQERREFINKIEAAERWLRQFVTNNSISEEYSAHISLSDINALLVVLGRPVIKPVQEFSFSFNVDYLVEGTILAPDEDAARRYVEELRENIDTPDYNEPSLDGDDEEWGDIDINPSYDYSDVDVWA